jgi:hypothetical protein
MLGVVIDIKFMGVVSFRVLYLMFYGVVVCCIKSVSR